MRLPHKTLEKNLFSRGYNIVAGVDEVGMGCLAGPVVVCAVSVTSKFFAKRKSKLHWLRDSKQLLPHQREAFAAELIQDKDIEFALGYAQVKTIDKINIYQASRLAMRRAIKKLKSQPDIVLVDGNSKIPALKIEQKTIIKGDRKIFCIACASIIAKVTRDKMMESFAKKYPNYKFDKHKGYGTKFHQSALMEFGPTPIHRRSFAPVAKLL
jgi:ribonuclease HII